ncbi:hypothetical protein Misp01_46690 [Microtetraspora sp. NBRC 13810]|uniref:lasso peptide biosynthesis B2 protein n=1 Tax=Microtetraspora sp. NBRC 13810 TaxID=3030990 RepID=UPI0024A50CBC|nr:lasso peptide biosynthesis B2 protein [Microtetraspora sp. NBRC 13810]GLW09540.1 hypothetical protein Misp01_46690 [Microtetraspora sp. NBRC 13810]
MSRPMEPVGGGRPSLRRRVAALPAVGVARLLAPLPPHRIRRVLRLVRRGAGPATAAQALAAREAVVSVSARCRGEGCLERSLATALLCRMAGTWPTWHAGVRTQPFRAHAWVEADGRPIGEPYPTGHFRPIMTVAGPLAGPEAGPVGDPAR